MNPSKLFILTIHPEATANQWAGKTKGIKNEFWHIRNGAEIIGTGRNRNAAWKDAENKTKTAK